MVFGLNKSRTLNFDDGFGNVETDGREVIGTMNEEDCHRFIVFVEANYYYYYYHYYYHDYSHSYNHHFLYSHFVFSRKTRSAV